MELCDEPGSLKRCMLALLFIKATNGVADAVTVPYFKEIARRMADENDPLYSMTLKDLTRPEYVAPLIRRCSKWVKNTYFICGVAQYIIDHKGSEFPNDENFYIAFREMGPKSVSLFMWAAFEENVWLAVDSHVFQSMKALGWTNAKTPEEATYQILRLGIVALKFSIKLNDAFGSIGQYTGSFSKKKAARALKYQKYTALEGLATTQDVKEIVLVLREYFSDIK